MAILCTWCGTEHEAGAVANSALGLIRFLKAPRPPRPRYVLAAPQAPRTPYQRTAHKEAQ